MIKRKKEQKQCGHLRCGPVCLFPKAIKKRYQLRRSPIQRKTPLKRKFGYRIPKKSAHRKQIEKIYIPAAKAFRDANPICTIQAPGCTNWTQGVHHKQGKDTDQLMLDQSKWLPACNFCNTYIEENSQWAYDHGFKLKDTVDNVVN